VTDSGDRAASYGRHQPPEVEEHRDWRNTVRGLDAVDGSPVLDVKPYMAEFSPQGRTVQPAGATELMRADY
jgi:tRNA (Thr-GGU) A37 N-methylase